MGLQYPPAPANNKDYMIPPTADTAACLPRRALLIAVLAFAGCWAVLTAVWAVPFLLGRAVHPIWWGRISFSLVPAMRVVFDGPLAMYDGDLGWTGATGYAYLPLPALLEAVPVFADVRLLWGSSLDAWGGRPLWRLVLGVWAPSASAGFLAYAAARRVGERAVAPVAVAAVASASILGWAHFEDVLLAAALIAACSGSRIGGAASLLIKQTAAAMALPMLWQRRRDPRFLLAVIGGAALVLAPFALATPGEFSAAMTAASTVRYPDEIDYEYLPTVRGIVPWSSYMHGRVAWVAASAVFAVWAARRRWHPLTATAVIAAARCPLFEPWPEPSHFTAGFVLCAAAAGMRSTRAAWACAAAAVVFRCWYADWWPMAWHFPELPAWPDWHTAPWWQAGIWWAVALPLVLIPAALAARGAATPAARPWALR